MSDALIKHAFHSTFPDGVDATKLQPSDWNAALLASGGTDGQALTRDSGSATGASWTTIGGGGSPGGLDTQVQFNDGTAFGGATGLTYTKGHAGGFTGFDTVLTAIMSDALILGQAVDVTNGRGTIVGVGQTTNSGLGNGAVGVQGLAVDLDLTGQGGATGVAGRAWDKSGGGAFGGLFTGIAAIDTSTAKGVVGIAGNGGVFTGLTLIGGDFLYEANVAAPLGIGVQIESPSTSSVITHSYGLYIGDQTVAGSTLNYAIYYAAPASQTFSVAASGDVSIAGALILTPKLVSALPASPLEGMLQVVLDSMTDTWGATITGSGGFHVLAYFNGTNWTVAGL